MHILAPKIPQKSPANSSCNVHEFLEAPKKKTKNCAFGTLVMPYLGLFRPRSDRKPMVVGWHLTRWSRWERGDESSNNPHFNPPKHPRKLACWNLKNHLLIISNQTSMTLGFKMLVLHKSFEGGGASIYWKRHLHRDVVLPWEIFLLRSQALCHRLATGMSKKTPWRSYATTNLFRCFQGFWNGSGIHENPRFLHF